MNPIDCMKTQLDRRFANTLGCAELESIARKVLLDLCKMNNWNSWLRRSDYTDRLKDDDGICEWSHGHWCGTQSYECSFSRFIERHPTEPGVFRVNEDFIKAMQYIGD